MTRVPGEAVMKGFLTASPGTLVSHCNDWQKELLTS